ncbi:MazG nucleotide pyrophosphohydrolase domain-containing protein [Ligilactobacillus acidipiscis]|jgi:NTP pyrophosphatase (non-canonical NTP hydrolase)|uniref:Predicted pyrophosphatase n=1 Tax=Ligilactobacillus acidipiscis TaxID=89059 RepID=A0A1W7QM42_9LACO|nr:MazG-like family protein [Ligilactobacillus acidipiscis]MCG0678474.1 hypothetical protein [Lactiplantibacillus plantarum]GAW65045.1 hypothetical protein Lacidipiscis_02273 [Ligilactobacillus acidipiscis]GEN21920.1 hypothetical protein LAC02_52010 [Ligilactobacillus acidipiscis]SPO49445.1 Predicted pyrophosphatase [Ligilactobacillus acidipiscis]
MNLKDHENWLVDFYKQRDWYKYTPPVRLNYLTEEVGELSRAIRSIEFGRDHPGERKLSTCEKFDNLNEGLADVIDQVLIICSQYDIDPTSLMEYSERKLNKRFESNQGA